MTETEQTNTDEIQPTYESITNPEAIAESEGLTVKQRTYTHESWDHCEADAIGRVIIGVADTDGRVLLLANQEIERAILPNDTVAPDEDWATVGRNCIEGYAGIDITLVSVERIRRVDHLLDREGQSPSGSRTQSGDGEDTPRKTTHHIVFGAQVPSGTTFDELCEDNDWEIGWYDELPFEFDDGGSGVRDDIELFFSEAKTDD